MAKAETSVANLGSGSVVDKVTSWPERLKDYFGELQAEMRAVTWPSWPQVRGTTGVVIVAVFAFAFYFALVDIVLGRAVQRIFDTFSK